MILLRIYGLVKAIFGGLYEFALIFGANYPDTSTFALSMLLFDSRNTSKPHSSPVALFGGLIMIAGTLIGLVTFRAR